MITQADRILELLRQAGEQGVSNRQLNGIAFRYSARIKDLRDKGHHIKAVKGKKRSEWVFTYYPPKSEQVNIFELVSQ